MCLIFGITFHRCSRPTSERQWWFKLEHYFCCSFAWVENRSNHVVEHKAKCQHKKLLRIVLYHCESFFRKNWVNNIWAYVYSHKEDRGISQFYWCEPTFDAADDCNSLHVTATQCSLYVTYCKGKGMALNTWNVVAWSKAVGHSSHSDVGCVDFWPIASGAIPAKDQMDPPQHGTISLQDSWQQE